jgi:hypothetical protein
VPAVARDDEVHVLLEDRIRKPRDPFRRHGGCERIQDEARPRLAGMRLSQNDSERPASSRQAVVGHAEHVARLHRVAQFDEIAICAGGFPNPLARSIARTAIGDENPRVE